MTNIRAQSPTLQKMMIQASKMSQWVVSCHNLDNLSLIPRTHTRRGKSTPETDPLISSCLPWYEHINSLSVSLCVSVSVFLTHTLKYTCTHQLIVIIMRVITVSIQRALGYAEVNSLKEIKEVIVQSCSPELD